MITEFPAGNRFTIHTTRHTTRLWSIGLLVCVLMTTGCPRMVSMTYQPSNPLKGQGVIGTELFRYLPAEEHRVRPRQVETDPLSKTELYLTQEIAIFFSDALRSELSRSGYQVQDSSDRIVSGTITRFYINWKSREDRSFELAADYAAQSGERTLFSWHCNSVQKGPDVMAEDGILIRRAIADCMHRFIAAAQEARVL